MEIIKMKSQLDPHCTLDVTTFMTAGQLDTSCTVYIYIYIYISESHVTF